MGPFRAAHVAARRGAEVRPAAMRRRGSGVDVKKDESARVAAMRARGHRRGPPGRVVPHARRGAGPTPTRITQAKTVRAQVETIRATYKASGQHAPIGGAWLAGERRAPACGARRRRLDRRGEDARADRPVSHENPRDPRSHPEALQTGGGSGGPLGISGLFLGSQGSAPSPLRGTLEVEVPGPSARDFGVFVGVRGAVVEAHAGPSGEHAAPATARWKRPALMPIPARPNPSNSAQGLEGVGAPWTNRAKSVPRMEASCSHVDFRAGSRTQGARQAGHRQSVRSRASRCRRRERRPAMG